MKIGIDINGVLRDTIGKFDQLYTKHLIEKDEDEYVEETHVFTKYSQVVKFLKERFAE